jgi:hypothetical protein
LTREEVIELKHFNNCENELRYRSTRLAREGFDGT